MNLKIGLLAPDLTHSHGWAHYATALIAALQRAGVPLRVVTAHNSPILNGLDQRALLPNLAPAARGVLLGQALALPQARAFLRDCNVIHALCEPYAPLAAALAGKRPLFVTAHGSYALVTQARRFPVNHVYAAAYGRACMICVSRYTESRLLQVLPTARTCVIANGIDSERFVNLERQPSDQPTVLSVGAIKPRKGTRELVHALAQARESIPHLRAYIVGSRDLEPAYAASVSAEIQRLGLSDSVMLTGRVSDAELIRHYASADVFALPARNIGWKFEGFGLALLEASAAGLPVIGSRGCGAEDAVIDGVTGMLVDQANMVPETARALIDLLTNRDHAQRMGAAGRDHARAHTWDRAAAALIDAYRAALNA